MAQQAFLLKVIGLPHIPSITEVNIRSGAGTNKDLIFKVPVGANNITILEAQTDIENRNFEGKVYQWFRAKFPQGEGWVRDDLVQVWGDGTKFGYPNLSTPTVGFAVTRSQNAFQAALSPQASTTTSATSAQAAPVTTTAAQPAPVTTAPAATSTATSAGPAMAMCMGKTGVNVRAGAGSTHAQLARMNYRESASILDTKAGEDNPSFHWVKVNYQGKEGWVREDFLRFSGAYKAFNLNSADKYPSPAPNSWWIRGFDPTGALYNTGPHHGWDHAGDKGAALLAGPQGGVVFDVVFCQRCGSQGLSTLESGFSLGDSRIFRDPSWNFGYGHYIIVGYEHAKLPESTKQYLAANGKAGWNIFVMYAHLQDMLVQKGAVLTGSQQIATLGNSGNSSGAHLHLEIRAAQTMAIQGWASINGGLMSPGVLFGF